MGDQDRDVEAGVARAVRVPEVKQLHMVSIELTAEQQSALKEITGEDILHLRLGVEELADLADLVAN